MKKAIQRTISSVLSILLFWGLCSNTIVSVFASDDGISDWDTIVQTASESVVYHASNLKLDLDFSNLYLFKKIPTYEFVNNRLVPLDIDYYPILEDGQVSALLLVYA